MSVAATLIPLQSSKATEVGDSYMNVLEIHISTQSGMVTVRYSYGHLQQARWVQIPEGGNVVGAGSIEFRGAEFDRIYNAGYAFPAIKAELASAGLT